MHHCASISAGIEMHLFNCNKVYCCITIFIMVIIIMIMIILNVRKLCESIDTVRIYYMRIYVQYIPYTFPNVLFYSVVVALICMLDLVELLTHCGPVTPLPELMFNRQWGLAAYTSMGNFTGKTLDIYPWYQLQNHFKYKIPLARVGQWCFRMTLLV